MSEQDRLAAAQNEMAVAEYQRRLKKTNEDGAANLGSQVWNEDVATFNRIAGQGREAEFTQLLVGTDVVETPWQVVHHVANNEGQYDGLGQLPGRQVVREFVKIDSAGEPAGRVKPSATPRYLASGNEGRSTPEEFRRTGGVHIKEDDVWNRDFDAMQKAKNRKGPR